MLPKLNRIPRSLFKNAIKSSKFIASSNFNFRYKFTPLEAATNPNSRSARNVPQMPLTGFIKEPEKRFAIVISKNTIKKATDRNLLRRRCYSIIQKNLTRIKNGVLGIFLAKKGVEKLKFIEMEKEIVGLLKKANILKNV